MIRALSSLLLALVLALTSQSMAVARGASAATGQMVLCTGAGPVAVYVDAKGQPTSVPHICPDAAFNVVVDHAETAISAPQRMVRFEPAQALAERAALSLPHATPPSRAPPLTA